jgi:hypothetical protein
MLSQKKTIVQVALGVYIIGTLIYIGYTQWSSFKIQYGDQAFQSGQTDVIERLITQAEKSDCIPFSVYTADKEVQLLNASCVQSSSNTETTNP